MSTNPYDPITTTDSAHLADDDWGLNLPKIRYNYGSSRFKGFCNFLRERARILIILGCVVVIGVLLISIVAVATHKSKGRKPSHHDKANRWGSPLEGLVFYPRPIDGSTVISFTGDAVKDKVLISSLLNVTDEYIHQNQLNGPYLECTENTNPPNKVCKLPDIRFGHECTKQQGYGYPHSAPCIFLQLNLPENVTIKPISENALLWPVAKLVMKNHNDSSYVPVYCQGTTKKDRAIIGYQGFDKGDPDPIQHTPVDGFPSFFYRPRNTSLPFIKPAVMVRLTSLTDNMLVHITCTAWGQLFDNNGQQIDHGLLNTTFGVYIHPRD